MQNLVRNVTFKMELVFSLILFTPEIKSPLDSASTKEKIDGYDSFFATAASWMSCKKREHKDIATDKLTSAVSEVFPMQRRANWNNACGSS